MKRFVLILCTMFFCVAAIAQTINIDWKVGNNIYSQSTCEYGSDLNVPETPPTKYGHTFQGWVSFAPIEYLESTGTQYIDTLSTVVKNTKIKFKYIPTVITSDNKMYGEWKTGDYSATYHFVGQYSGFFRLWNYADYPTNILCESDREYNIEAFFGDDYYLKINGITTIKGNKTFIWNNDNAYLFAGNHNNSPITATRAKLYYFKIWQDDILVRDFIPVLDKDGTPCMFDKVEGKFYYNQGTGQFIAGPVI